jgi:hypothetical protein
LEGELYTATARFDEAIAEGKRAEDLDPFSLIVINERGNVLRLCPAIR